MNEELDSQLSAMFDNELPAAECELLARRLSRDEQLKARWGRYAAIGATIRAEGGVRLNVEVARRVSKAISSEPAMPAAAADRPGLFAARWWRPVAGVAMAASVAAVSILWLRLQTPTQERTAANGLAPTSGTVANNAPISANPANSYVVPRVIARRSIVPSTQLANYVVAHSEFSSPVNRGNLLSALIASETPAVGTSSGTEEPASEEPTEELDDDAKSPK